MDLGAYAQIEDLNSILLEQDISIPRLRGLRLMKNEKKVSNEDVGSMIRAEILDMVTDIVEQGCRWFWCSWKADTRNDILIRNEDRQVVDYRLDKIHGKKRKKIKFEIKKIKRAFKQQYELFNKYAGEDVLYVHARIGGPNWFTYGGDELTKHPDYLDMCDDAYDDTYCDIYFRLKEKENEKNTDTI